MSQRRNRLTLLAAIAPWLVLACGLVLATAPAWRVLLLGFHPTLDELLKLRCFGAAP